MQLTWLSMPQVPFPAGPGGKHRLPVQFQTGIAVVLDAEP
jgi:hypothetical protein